MGDTKRDYEMVVLFHPDLEMDLDKPLKKVEGIITAQKGEITKTSNWGKRKLAYPINKQEHAVYVYYEISVGAEAVSKIQNTLNITNEVLRYLLTTPVPVVEESEETAEEDKAAASDEKSDKEKDEEKDEDDEAKPADDTKE